MPFGAEPTDGGGRFRLWAPAASAIELSLEGPGPRRSVTMARLADGWFEAEVPEAAPGTRYKYRIDGDAEVPDPASRFQPEDVHGASELIDPGAFDWADDGWLGRPWEETVLYELHVGAFTGEGTFAGLERRLDHLVELGVTAVELMPLADSPGGRNWGYDGVYPFAPEDRYGRPEDLKGLIQAAHQRGLMVFLDVVYNHFGPEGNYLASYAPPFFTERYHTPWGAAIDFDGPHSRTVRDFFIHNALYWLEEYHIDGLRLDAVHAIYDASEPDILVELAETVRDRVGKSRHVHLVLENDHNAAHYLARDADRTARWYVAQWNDDIHHALHVLLTGEQGGYYEDYADAPIRHLGRCLTEGFAYQGEASRHRGGRPRGDPSAHLPATAFVSFLQNHDQVGNRALGERITAFAAPEAVRAALAVMLLAPSPPLLFMGEEWAAAQTFPFFCDFGPELAEAVREGRRREFARFPEFRDAKARERIPDPNAPDTFARAVLNWADLRLPPHREWLAFYRALLALRHREIVPRLRGLVGGRGASYETVGDRGLVARWRLGDDSLLSLIANLGEPAIDGLPPSPEGRPVYATDHVSLDGLAEGKLPGWSVAWFLDMSEPGRSL
jgi:malto-oligosyltrehalose trehalohydrolase